MSPPKDEVPKEILLRVILKEKQPAASVLPALETNYLIKVNVIEPIVYDFIPPTEKEEKETKVQVKTVKAAVTSLDSFGKMTINFNADVEWPSDVKTWESSNKGAEYFNFIYLPSDETLDSMEESKVSQRFTWKVESATSTTITFAFDFDLTDFVSVDIKDSMEVEYLDSFNEEMSILPISEPEGRIAKIEPLVNPDY